MIKVIAKIIKQHSYLYWVLAACALAAALRIWFPWDSIFSSGHINFSGPDSYYQMNIARQLLDGALPAGIPSFYAQLIVGLSWLISFGNPSFSLVEVVAVFLPVLFAVGTVVFVYFIGKLSHSRLAGCIAAFTVAVLPGEYFARSWLGSVDYHAAEVFFTTGAILFLILLWKTGDKDSWRIAIYNILASSCFVVYLLIWPGAIGFALILALFAVVFIMRRLSCNKWMSRIFIALVTVGFCLSAFVLLRRISDFSSFITSNTAEAQPGWTDMTILLHIFLTLIFSFIYYRRKGTLKIPVVFWSVAMVAATFWQRRFDYYLIVPFAILTGFALATHYREILNWSKPRAEPESLPAIHSSGVANE